MSTEDIILKQQAEMMSVINNLGTKVATLIAQQENLSKKVSEIADLMKDYSHSVWEVENLKKIVIENKDKINHVEQNLLGYVEELKIIKKNISFISRWGWKIAMIAITVSVAADKVINVNNLIKVLKI